VPQVATELGRTAFSYLAPCGWNNLQKELKLETLMSIKECCDGDIFLFFLSIIMFLT